MNEINRTDYVDKMSRQLDVWGARLAVVQAHVALASTEARIDYQKQIVDWQTKESAFKAKMEEIRAAGIEGFAVLEASAQSAWKELSTIVEKFGDKK